MLRFNEARRAGDVDKERHFVSNLCKAVKISRHIRYLDRPIETLYVPYALLEIVHYVSRDDGRDSFETPRDTMLATVEWAGVTIRGNDASLEDGTT